MVVAMESYALRDSNVVTKLRKLKIKELLHDERSAPPPPPKKGRKSNSVCQLLQRGTKDCRAEFPIIVI